MPIWALVALAVSVSLVALTAFYAVAATTKLFVGLNRLGKALMPVTDELAAASERLSRRAEATAIGFARLEQSVASLRASREQLGVLRFALEDVLRMIRFARGLVPKK